jgi:hypothetical protein
MAKEYGIKFGTGALTATAGLSPTFINFVRMDTGGTLTPPGITALIPALGIYKFNYQPSFPIFFEIDGATTGLGTNRYIQGTLDPNDRVDEFTQGISNLIFQYGQSLVALGNTNVALGTSNIALGTTNVAIGTSGYAQAILNFGIGQSLVALGNSNVALGTTNVAIGTSGYAQAILNFGIGTSIVALGNTNVALGTSNYAWGNTNFAIGTSNLAQGVTILSVVNGISSFAMGFNSVLASIGTTASSFGDTAVNPGTLYGYLKRLQEFNEGNNTYIKATGLWSVFSRGSSTLLAYKTLAETASQVTKT